MARSTWSGTITFGLINIPVSLYTSVRDDTIAFRQLCPVHKARIEQRTVCREGGEELSETVRGYEVTEGTYIVLTDADLERAALPMSKTFDIDRFVPETQLATSTSRTSSSRRGRTWGRPTCFSARRCGRAGASRSAGSRSRRSSTSG